MMLSVHHNLPYSCNAEAASVVPFGPSDYGGKVLPPEGAPGTLHKKKLARNNKQIAPWESICPDFRNHLLRH